MCVIVTSVCGCPQILASTAISPTLVDAYLSVPSESSEWAGSFHKQEEHNQLGGEKNERSLVKKEKKEDCSDIRRSNVCLQFFNYMQQAFFFLDRNTVITIRLCPIEQPVMLPFISTGA